MVALYLYRRYIQQWEPQLTLLRLLDYLAIPSALAACFIRLGNFINQEISRDAPQRYLGGCVRPTPMMALSLLRDILCSYMNREPYLVAFFILWHFWKRQKIEDRPDFS